MQNSQATPPRQQLLVFWVLWAAFLAGVGVQYHFLHRTSPPPADDSKTWIAAAGPLLVSMILRWNVIPRIGSATTLLPIMIVGIALAESATFIGIFLFPAHQWELFLGSLLCLAQFAPVYAARLFAEGGQNDRLR